MRVLQLVDSLEVGGAETLAVNYANALSVKISFSGLVATRKEGKLKANIEARVGYEFLAKKSALDLKAIFRLKRFVVENNVAIIHAHGTSYFTASVLKLLLPGLKIVWHEHYGARVKQTQSGNLMLVICSFFFNHIFVVNAQLKDWMHKNLKTKKIDYIPNFAMFPKRKDTKTVLSGQAGKRIVCLANLKKPKNHLFLLQAFAAVKADNNTFDWSLHFIGQDFNDAYSEELKTYIRARDLQESVFLYGLKTDVENILQQTEIGVLASTDEGFPVSLLEFALAQVPVISTNAGYCGAIVKDGHTGLLFDPSDARQLETRLQKLISSPELRQIFRERSSESAGEFSEEKVIALLMSKYGGL